MPRKYRKLKPNSSADYRNRAGHAWNRKDVVMARRLEQLATDKEVYERRGKKKGKGSITRLHHKHPRYAK